MTKKNDNSTEFFDYDRLSKNRKVNTASIAELRNRVTGVASSQARIDRSVGHLLRIAEITVIFHT